LIFPFEVNCHRVQLPSLKILPSPRTAPTLLFSLQGSGMIGKAILVIDKFGIDSIALDHCLYDGSDRSLEIGLR